MNAKLKTTPGIYLAGFMGCGKSTAGRLAAEQLGWEFVDLDEEIVREAGRPIAEIFSSEGEQAFRDLEHQAVCEQARLARAGSARVVALGGGAFAFERNRLALDEAGVTVWLDAPAAALWERVKQEKHRPLARDRDAFESLLESRLDAYGQAGVRLDATPPPEEVAEAIVELLV